jgi:hypothetical protein
MNAYPKREDSRNCFPERVEKNHRRPEHVAVIRRVGPRWVTAGRCPRAIPVFFIHRTILSVPAASEPFSPAMGSADTRAPTRGAVL